MPCMKIESGYICYGKAYKFKGFYFEWHSFHGPCTLKKDGEPRKTIPAGFWEMVSEFQMLSDEEKEGLRVR